MHASLRLAALLVLAPAASAATFNVTRFDDPAPNGCGATDCSLREAVVAANATTAADTVALPAGTYALTRTCTADTANCHDLDITQPLTINGAGTSATTIANAIPQFPLTSAVDRAHTRVVEVHATQLKLQGLGIRSGYLAVALNGTKAGGCLLAQAAALTLTDVHIEQCTTLVGTPQSGAGGGVALIDSTALMTRVILTSNAAQSGGGLHARNGWVRGTAVQISNNQASSNGGGVMLLDAPLTLGGGSRISGNTASSGGGIAIAGFAGVTVQGANATAGERIQIMDNWATTSGGGVHLAMVNSFAGIGAYALRNLLMLRNTAEGAGAGASVFLSAAGPVSVEFTDREFAENDSDGDAAGLYFEVAGAGADSHLQRLSFWNNVSGGRGGAMRVIGAPRLRHVSTYSNYAIEGNSLYVPGTVVPQVEFLTALEPLGNAISTAATTSFHASVIVGSCSGPWTDLGSNFRRDDATGCPGTAATATQLSIAFGQYGGGHPVVGITSAASILRNQALNYPGTRDVRGWLRQGLADAGAFELDGVP